MGYFSKVQVIQRGNKNKQYYLICPVSLAQALELEKGEIIEWVIENKDRIIFRRSLKNKKEIKEITQC
ncbi:MAG: hypothetical protein HY761_07380 [Candidatus Omnitrophica bacterium]|nr:hypothetical protein [Candidatus Omnitrophota bacterium]